MTFYDVRFPSNGNWGTTAEPRFNTTVVDLPSGARERVSRWSGSSRLFDVAYDVRSYSQILEVYKHFQVMRGAGNTFPYKDWADYSSNMSCRVDNYVAPTAADQVLGIADGNTYTYQITKSYPNGLGTPLTRNIYLPVAGTFRLTINGVEYTTGFTVSRTAGTVTFTNKPGTSGGLGGTGVLGMTIYCGFEFDCHVAYDVSVDKALKMAMDQFGSGSIPNLLLVEEVDSVPVYDEINHGGSSYQAFDAAMQLTTAMGKLVRLRPSDDYLTVYLPSITGYVDGGDYFTLYNEDALNHVKINYLGTTIATMDPQTWLDLYIGYDNTGTLTWQGRQ